MTSKPVLDFHKSKHELGLNVLQTSHEGRRCMRCDFPLEYSLWNGVRIGHITNVNTYRKFCHNVLCVKCIQSSQGKYRKTPEELDNFVLELRIPQC